jgi:hypothetical protein
MTAGQLLELGSDRALRRRLFDPASIAHPAKLHLGLAQWLIDRYTAPGDIIADGMGGIGSALIAALQQRHVILREIEPCWLSLAQKNADRISQQGGMFAGQIAVSAGDAREPWGVTCDHILMSPPYGCDMPYHGGDIQAYIAQRTARLKDAPHGKRWAQLLAAAAQQRGAVGFELFDYGKQPGQIGRFTGARYYAAMAAIYRQAHQALRPGGLLILVLKDHIRDGQRVPTADQTAALCATLGFTLVQRHQRHIAQPSLWQRRRKEQGLPIVEEEDVLVFERTRP